MAKDICVITGGGSGMGLEAARYMNKDTCIDSDYSKRFVVHAVCIDTQTTDDTKLKE